MTTVPQLYFDKADFDTNAEHFAAWVGVAEGNEDLPSREEMTDWIGQARVQADADGIGTCNGVVLSYDPESDGAVLSYVPYAAKLDKKKRTKKAS